MADLNITVLKVLQVGHGELATLRDNLSTGVVLHTLGGLSLGEGHQLVDQNILQVVNLSLMLLVNLSQRNLVLNLVLTGFHGTGKEFLVNDDTCQRRIGLQGRVFHVTSLVAEDSAKQLLFRRGIALTLWRDLTNQDVSWLHTGTDTNDTILVKVLRSLFTDVGNICGELFCAALRFTDIKRVFINMHRGQHVLTDNSLVEHNGILVVVTLPRHIGYQQVATQCELAILSSVAFCQDVTLLHTLTLVTDRTQVDGHVLVGTTELGNTILLQGRLKADKLLVISTVIEDTDGRGINIVDNAIALGCNHGARVFTHLLFNTSTYDRSLVMKQRNGLTHHVGTHQRTVGVVMLEEWNERCGDRGNLLRRDIHQVNLSRRHNREVGILTALDYVTDEAAIITQRSITLTDNVTLLFLSSQIYDTVVIQIGDTIFHLTVRSGDKAELVNLGIDTQRRNQTDVRAFRTLDRTETTVVCIMYVTNLETGTLTRQTARTQGRETTLVRHLGQRVRLIHELRQRVGADERIDDT